MHFLKPYQINDNTIDIFISKNKNMSLKCNIHYIELPKAVLFDPKQINEYYQNTSLNQLDYILNQLIEPAIHNEPIDHSYQEPTYEWDSNYNISFNKSPILSLYTDAHQFTGGAHGITMRTSETWNVAKNVRMNLKEFFPTSKDYKSDIENNIIKQIQVQMSNGQNQYFENYPDLVHESFKPENFYLMDSPLRLIIYFQQYDIAPYSSDIPEFIIPVTGNTDWTL